MKQREAITIMKRRSKGFSLVELLAAILILSLVSGGLVTGILLSSNQYKNSMRQSEANELYNTISSLLTNELRFTNKIRYKTGTNEVEAFKSVSYQIDDENLCNIYILNDEGYLTIKYGHIALGEIDKKVNYLIGAAAYTNGLGAKIHGIKYDTTEKLFTVDLDIGYNDKSIIRNTFNVRALNTVIVDG